MKALIVESTHELGALWTRHLERYGIATRHAVGQTDAVELLENEQFEILVVDLILDEGSPLAIADFANYKHPDSRVIFVTNTSFFSDGSIFRHCANACAFLQSDSPPDDLVAMVEHFGSTQRNEPPLGSI